MKRTVFNVARVGIYILLVAAAVVIRQAGKSILGPEVEVVLGMIVIIGFAGCFGWALFRAKKADLSSREGHE